MSRKIYVTVILMLFLLPLVSWYYLQSGLNWRKQAQQVMSGKDPFPAGRWIDANGKIISSDMLAEHVTVVTLEQCNDQAGISETVDSLYNQFKQTNKAIFITLNACKEKSLAGNDTTRISWFVFNCNDSTSLCSALLSSWPEGKTHALVDRNMLIRAYYSENSKEEKRILLEHTALLLPKERSEKIELKRGNEK